MLQLSLITITKDDPAGLTRTLESAAAWRALPGVEQIVVFAGARPPLPGGAPVVFCPQRATGIADAFNTGLAEAKGTWVWFLNGGDAIHESLDPAWLLALLHASTADIITGDLVYGTEGKPRGHPPLHRQWPPLLTWIPHPSTVVRRSLFDRFGGFAERYSIAMDYEWWLRVLSSEVKMDLVSVPFAVFAPGGISQREDCRKQITKERDDVIRRYQARLWKLWFVSACRLLRMSLRAFFAARLGRSRPASRDASSFHP
jgi:hypothetical protein